MNHPSDHRWDLACPDYRPTIAVIEPATTPQPRTGKVNRVPFGFARVLVDRGACGYLHPRNPQFGGCIKTLGHSGAHQWRPHDPGSIRPTPPPELPLTRKP